MKVILQQDIKGIGKKGDVKDVADGYALNFLVPQKKAVLANEKNLERHRATLLQRDIEKHENNKAFTAVQKALTPQRFHIRKKADDKGHLYAAVSVEDVLKCVRGSKIPEADVLTDARVHIDPPIKSIGMHKVLVAFDSTRRFFLTLEVERE